MTESSHTKLEYTSLQGGGRIATLILNRPDQANAFSAQMMDEITSHVGELKLQNDVRLLVITGSGRHFSAGADLGWMQAAAKLSYEENLRDAERLRSMFEGLLRLDIPTVASISGAVYGGAVGLVACCDYAVASESAKFCLSEARLGLLPAVIAPYLLRKMKPGQLKRMALTSKVFDAHEAKEFGLIEVVARDLDAALQTEINALLTCGPEAQKAIHRLFEDLRSKNNAQGQETVEAISKARTGSEGQSGLSSFFAKTTPSWVRTVNQTES